jgi:UDP-N-acetylglucosamine:LPS N-acetylglucosamine transferase
VEVVAGLDHVASCGTVTGGLVAQAMLMRTKALILVGGGGWGREALEILPGLPRHWDRTYLTTFDTLWWYERNPLDGVIHFVPRLQPRPGPRALARLASRLRPYLNIARLVLRVRPEVVLGVCTDLSLPVMALARLLGARTYYVESLTRVHTPSRTARLLARFRLADALFVQHPSLKGSLPRSRFVWGLL